MGTDREESSLLFFNLAPHFPVRPERIVDPVHDNAVSAFVLALSVLYNDLKGLLLLQGVLESQRPTGEETSAERGQWNGMRVQLVKLTCGCLYELTKAVRTNGEAIRDPEFQAILDELAQRDRKRWDSLVDASQDNKKSPRVGVWRALARIRNNLAFHYGHPKDLVAGYRDHFFRNPTPGIPDAAYVSIGSSMEHVRFYYADAAVQRSLETSLSAAGGSMGEEYGRVVRDVNAVLANLISVFVIKRKNQTVQPEPAAD